jgi:hypothetical protein
MLETIGTVSVGGGGNERVGDGEVLDVDEGCCSCWTEGVGRGGRGLSQGCLKDSVEVMRFLSLEKKSII